MQSVVGVCEILEEGHCARGPIAICQPHSPISQPMPDPFVNAAAFRDTGQAFIRPKRMVSYVITVVMAWNNPLRGLR